MTKLGLVPTAREEAKAAARASGNAVGKGSAASPGLCHRCKKPGHYNNYCKEFEKLQADQVKNKLKQEAEKFGEIKALIDSINPNSRAVRGSPGGDPEYPCCRHEPCGGCRDRTEACKLAAKDGRALF